MTSAKNLLVYEMQTSAMVAYMPASVTLAPASVVEVPVWVRCVELVPQMLAVVLLALFLVGQIRCERFVYTVLFANLFASAATLSWHSAQAAEKRRA